MTAKKAGDIMVPLEEYPVVDSSATVLDAVIRLDESRHDSKPGRQPYQAVLVADKYGKIVGKLGQMALLKALEPRSRVADDQDALDRAGVSDALMETAMGHIRTFRMGLTEVCVGISAMPIHLVMDPFDEHIDHDAPIYEVIHKMLEWKALSLLVSQDDRPVGLVRLSDLCDEVMGLMRQAATGTSEEDR